VFFIQVPEILLQSLPVLLQFHLVAIIHVLDEFALFVDSSTHLAQQLFPLLFFWKLWSQLVGIQLADDGVTAYAGKTAVSVRFVFVVSEATCHWTFTVFFLLQVFVGEVWWNAGAENAHDCVHYLSVKRQRRKFMLEGGHLGLLIHYELLIGCG
jgi:hypothetical protein